MVNVLPIRIDLSGQPTFIDLVQRTQTAMMGGLLYQNYPFDKMVQDTQSIRSVGRTALYDVMFNMPVLGKNTEAIPFMEGTAAQPVVYQGLHVEPFDLDQQAAHAPLELDLWSTETGIVGFLKYDTDLFTSKRVQTMVTQYLNLLEQIVVNSTQSIELYSLLTPDVPLPNPTCPLSSKWIGAVHELFSQQAREGPNALAVVGENDCWTYGDLDRQTNQLANYLLTQGIRPEDVVAIYAKRSAELVTAILGVLKAGAAFLILDPAYPAQRLLSYLQLANPKGLLTIDTQPLSEELASQVTTIGIYLELSNAELDRYSGTSPEIQIGPDDLAVITFTSGSTGQPKGVLGRHGPLTHFLPWQRKFFDLRKSDRYNMLSGLAHDPLQRDIFTPLALGATLYIPSAEQYSQPDYLVEWMAEQQITIAQLTPAMIQLLAIGVGSNVDDKTALTTLRRAFVIGDVLTKQNVSTMRQLAPNSSIINSYGSTETQRAVGYFLVPSTTQETDGKQTLPAGKGLQDVQLLVLNRAQQVAGIGELGEIFIRSPHLAKGYLNDEQLTTERFRINPFTEQPEDRLYKSGDWGRYLPDGNVEYFGRIDNQIQIRGFRIELGEIEHVLLMQTGVCEAVVLAQEDARGDKQLVAYVVPASPEESVAAFWDEDVFIATLRKALQERLPAFMIPVAFVILDALPLTPNGKLDRRVLPKPEYVRLQPFHVPAKTFDESRLILVWQEVLGVHPIGVEDNFFESGGHSLLITQLVQRMSQTLQRPISIQQIFQAPTIRGLLQVLDQKMPSTTSFIPLRSIESCAISGRSPLFLFHSASGAVFPYLSLLPYLSSTEPVYALQARGIYDDLLPFKTVEALVKTSTQEMKTIQPYGPYAISGWSFGGMVAFAVACELMQQGEEVSFLGVIDMYPLNMDQSIDYKMPTVEEDLQAFFYYLDDVMGGHYRSLNEEIFATAAEQNQPFEGLLDQIAQADHPFVVEQSIIKRIWETMFRNRQLFRGYQPQYFDGLITLFCAEESAPDDGPQRWQALTSQSVETIWVSGDHNTMFNVEKVEKLGCTLENQLQQVHQSSVSVNL